MEGIKGIDWVEKLGGNANHNEHKSYYYLNEAVWIGDVPLDEKSSKRSCPSLWVA